MEVEGDEGAGQGKRQTSGKRGKGCCQVSLTRPFEHYTRAGSTFRTKAESSAPTWHLKMCRFLQQQSCLNFAHLEGKRSSSEDQSSVICTLQRLGTGCRVPFLPGILQPRADVCLSHFSFAGAFLFFHHLDRENKRKFSSEEQIKA